MKQAKAKISEPTQQILKIIGEKLMLARKQRLKTQSEFAIDLGVSRSTVKLIEKGAPGVAFNTYIEAFIIIGKHFELIQFASTDTYGQKLQYERMLARMNKVPVPSRPEQQYILPGLSPTNNSQLL